MSFEEMRHNYYNIVTKNRNGVAVYIGGVCNVYSAKKRASVVFTKAETLLKPCFDNVCKTGTDNLLRWRGVDESVIRTYLRDNIAYRADLSMCYRDFEIDKWGTRSQAGELEVLEACKRWKPFITWKHIGNHRESKGWRDIAGYDSTGALRYLIEVKCREGRMF